MWLSVLQWRSRQPCSICPAGMELLQMVLCLIGRMLESSHWPVSWQVNKPRAKDAPRSLNLLLFKSAKWANVVLGGGSIWPIVVNYSLAFVNQYLFICLLFGGCVPTLTLTLTTLWPQSPRTNWNIFFAESCLLHVIPHWSRPSCLNDVPTNG